MSLGEASEAVAWALIITGAAFGWFILLAWVFDGTINRVFRFFRRKAR